LLLLLTKARAIVLRSKRRICADFRCIHLKTVFSIKDYLIHTRLPTSASPKAFAQFKNLLLLADAEYDSTAHVLSAMQQELQVMHEYQFVDQDSMQDTRYYEEIIYQDKRIPTRNNNWHDFFNGFIWLTYPNTKALLNRLHWQDIQMLGHKKRTPRRDRITHFDECGIILLTNKPTVAQQLSEHQWHDLFYHQRSAWFEDIVPMHFGHANLEMLCQPFIGLTAKALVIESPTILKAYHENKEAGRKQLDIYLAEKIERDGLFDERGVLAPLPLLGIPGWHNATQDKSFYDNTDYFMPVRSKR
jgi:hypothetical protein